MKIGTSGFRLHTATLAPAKDTTVGGGTFGSAAGFSATGQGGFKEFSARAAGYTTATGADTPGFTSTKAAKKN